MTFPSIVLRLTYGSICPLLPLTPCWLADWSFIFFCVCSLSSTAPTEPLLCKFADGGQKKRQSQSKYPQNGRPWHREGEVSADDLKDLQYQTSSTRLCKNSESIKFNLSICLSVHKVVHTLAFLIKITFILISLHFKYFNSTVCCSSVQIHFKCSRWNSTWIQFQMTQPDRLYLPFPRQLLPYFLCTFPFPEYPTLVKGMSRKQTLCFKHRKE